MMKGKGDEVYARRDEGRIGRKRCCHWKGDNIAVTAWTAEETVSMLSAMKRIRSSHKIAERIKKNFSTPKTSISGAKE
jgi:hypothetical protein